MGTTEEESVWPSEENPPIPVIIRESAPDREMGPQWEERNQVVMTTATAWGSSSARSEMARARRMRARVGGGEETPGPTGFSPS